jgi:hypothetical protein
VGWPTIPSLSRSVKMRTVRSATVRADVRVAFPRTILAHATVGDRFGPHASRGIAKSRRRDKLLRYRSARIARRAAGRGRGRRRSGRVGLDRVGRVAV